MKKDQIQFSLNINDNEISNLDNLIMEHRDKINNKLRNHKGKYCMNIFTSAHARLRETVEYCNSSRMIIDYNDKYSSYMFTDWIIYVNLITDYSIVLGSLFGYEILEKYSETIFCQPKEITTKKKKIKSNDIQYMRYLRSICIMHTTKTDRFVSFGYQEKEESSIYASRMNFPIKSIITADINGKTSDSVVKRINRNFDVEESFYIRVGNNDHSDYRKAEVETNEYYAEMIENGYLEEEEINALIDNKSIGLDRYIIVHPNEIVEFVDNIMAELKAINDVIKNYCTEH
ncbi:hypothetical protein PT155_08760 [Erysipelothrix rhusiopathiae]|uniref:hypothetical protein n=1 Tax=Erysipelothrix rhusiopathiae TaxID=1648 RepID=UPI000E01C7F2|nr:hypothetical protein [Erysipelothrix rhusiopathiae]MDE8252304.1 hypothetical protein [Erysipelothrix rhusiopathiae]MDE8265838.1 hypothetical protein [Erysipelothrix rhusiopathiae]MDE8267511.1 hypothetical protein [Erysipelothrix rhusiopathiae]MDE8274308.1 hypothetical protein [Erysipelothrix rhusiopathiae]MDE8313403.1 hypothetical protein [Erysipelothrix rhusiopathiae]